MGSELKRKLDYSDYLVIPSDGRRWEIGLTREGRAVFDAIAPRSEAVYRAIEREVGAEKLDRLLKLLHAVSTIDED